VCSANRLTARLSKLFILKVCEVLTRHKPTIYLIPECDTDAELDQALRERCEEIFIEQLAGWFNDRTTWPRDRGFDAFCRWFDFRHHSMLVDLCDEPLILKGE
jgi:hypothetical protein